MAKTQHSGQEANAGYETQPVNASCSMAPLRPDVETFPRKQMSRKQRLKVEISFVM